MAKQSHRKENRLRRQVRIAGEVGRNPRRAWPLFCSALLRVWRTRGGGLYGLGYVLTFGYLEVRFFVTEFLQSAGVVDFFTAQLMEHVFRFGLQSMLNSVHALIWPVYVMQAWRGWGIALLALGFIVFDRLLKPAVERRFPSLSESCPG